MIFLPTWYLKKKLTNNIFTNLEPQNFAYSIFQYHHIENGMRTKIWDDDIKMKHPNEHPCAVYMI